MASSFTKVRINGKEFIPSRILKTEKEHSLGYQHLDQDDLQPNECLIFVFDDQDMYDGRQFHMENCDSFDIKLYALDRHKRLIDSFVMNKSSKNRYPIKNSGQCKYVVEVPVVIS